MTLRCHSPHLAALLDGWRDETTGLVFVADDKTGEAWSEVAAELTDAFHLAKQSLSGGLAVVFVVHNDDLLGRNGPGKAMVAMGLLSAARTAALEHRKAGVAVNVVAREDDTDPSLVARWCELLMEGELPTGELVHLGSEHLGKALP
jgi:hypothetical protein